MDISSCLIALDHINGIGWHTISTVLSLNWIPSTDSTLIPYLQQTRATKAAIAQVSSCWSKEYVQERLANLKRQQITAITYFDPLYPPLLKEIAQPPWVLYTKGDLSLLTQKAIAIVGTRRMTPYGERATHRLVEQLVDHGFVINSGLAKGIDGHAHRCALLANGKTVAVLGTGIDVIYPIAHKNLYGEIVNKGLVISEMPPGTTARHGLFPRRNRIISGLSLGTIVVEAAEKSGSLITAGYSLEQNREVFAVPGPLDALQSAGVNNLLKQGAKCATCLADILEELPDNYSMNTAPQEQIAPSETSASTEENKNYSAEELVLLNAVTQSPITFDEIWQKVSNKLSINKVYAALLSLELQGSITQYPGSLYSLA